MNGSQRQIREGKQSQSLTCPVEPLLRLPGKSTNVDNVRKLLKFLRSHDWLSHLHEVEVSLVEQNNDSSNPGNTYLETCGLQHYNAADMATMILMSFLTTTHWSESPELVTIF